MISAWRTVARTCAALIAVLAVVFGLRRSRVRGAGRQRKRQRRPPPTHRRTRRPTRHAPTTTSTDTASPPVTARAHSDSSSTDSDAKSGGTSTASDHQTQGTAGTSGTPPESQPLSGADQNYGGANGKCPGGPYCASATAGVGQRQRWWQVHRQAVRRLRRQGRQQEPEGSVPRPAGPQQRLRVRPQPRHRAWQPGPHRLHRQHRRRPTTRASPARVSTSTTTATA